jgi:solute carrier family 25 ornithine transporter 2/15
VYTGQPFDTVKVRMQVNPTLYAGSVHCFQKTISNEAVSSLWKGSVPAFLGALCENAVAFAINGCLKRVLAPLDSHFDDPSKINWKQPVLTGGITGLFTAFVLCPSDVVKSRAQISASVSHNMRSITSEIIARRGYAGLFTGIGAQLLRDVPFGAAFFGSYEIMCQLFRKHSSMSECNIYFMSGGFAGQIAWLTTMGLDCIKSEIQTAEVPKSIAATAADIWRARGLRGFFAGAGVTVLRAFPANAALFLAYEQTKKLLTAE